MGFRFSGDLSSPYYLGGGSSTLVPHVAEVSLGGHPYMIDWSNDLALAYQGMSDIKPQQDQSNSAGEQSVSPDSYWRRAVDSWHTGAGQIHYDDKFNQEQASSRSRFRASQGIDFWDKFEFKLLHDTVQERATASTNLKAIVAGTHVYLTDGVDIKYWTDVTGGTFTSLTGEPANQATDIVSDGFNVWTAHGTNGIYKTTRGAATTASHITGTVEGLGFVRNRVMAFNNNILYDVTALAVGGAPGALPAAFYTHGNTDWQWVGFAEGAGQIYIAGFSGDKSRIFRTAVKSDGTALDAPVIAAELIDGEVITCIDGYIGRFVLIGTNKGWRLAITGTNGDLTVGALVPTTSPVMCFEAQEEFVWYGLTNFTTIDTGLGRLSTSVFSDLDNLVPAYGSDLMATAQGTVTSILTFQDRRMFTVNGVGFYYESTNLVAEGYIDSGLVNFNLTEPKIGMFLDAQHSGSAGEHEVLVSVDEGPFISLGMHVEGQAFNLGQVSGMNFEIRNILMRDTVDPTLGLKVHSWLLRVQPQAKLTDYIYVTVLLAPEVESLVDSPIEYDTLQELLYINSLYRSKEITTFQIGTETSSIILENYQLPLDKQMVGANGMRGFNGSCTMKLKNAF